MTSLCVAGEFFTSRVQWGERGGSGLHQKYETTSVTASVKLCCFKPSLDLSAFLESDTLPGFDDSVPFHEFRTVGKAAEPTNDWKPVPRTLLAQTGNL